MVAPIWFEASPGSVVVASAHASEFRSLDSAYIKSAENGAPAVEASTHADNLAQSRDTRRSNCPRGVGARVGRPTAATAPCGLTSGRGVDQLKPLMKMMSLLNSKAPMSGAASTLRGKLLPRCSLSR